MENNNACECLKENCEDGKCNIPAPAGMKEKAIKMLIETFSKKLRSVESLACRNTTPELVRKRKELLDVFEEYLKELLIC